MLPVLQAEVLCDCVENLHLVPQLGLRVDVSHPQTAGVFCYVADLDLSSRSAPRWSVSSSKMSSQRSKTVFILNRTNVNFVILIFIYLQVLYLQVVNTDVIADGMIDSSHRPINLVHFLSQPAHLS